jgi:hypothetical protein
MWFVGLGLALPHKSSHASWFGDWRLGSFLSATGWCHLFPVLNWQLRVWQWPLLSSLRGCDGLAWPLIGALPDRVELEWPRDGSLLVGLVLCWPLVGLALSWNRASPWSNPSPVRWCSFPVHLGQALDSFRVAVGLSAAVVAPLSIHCSLGSGCIGGLVDSFGLRWPLSVITRGLGLRWPYLDLLCFACALGRPQVGSLQVRCKGPSMAHARSVGSVVAQVGSLPSVVAPSLFAACS